MSLYLVPLFYLGAFKNINVISFILTMIFK